MTTAGTRLVTDERAFAFLRLNERPPKPRSRGVTELRGPYYTPVGRRYLEDLLETMGVYVDALKYARGSFALMPREAVRALNDVCHEHEVEVSTRLPRVRARLARGRGRALPGGVPRARLRHRGDLERLRHPPSRGPRPTNEGGARGGPEAEAGGRDPVRRRPAAPPASKPSKPRGHATSDSRSS